MLKSPGFRQDKKKKKKKKTGMIVPSFYLIKKQSAAHPSPSSMDYDESGQDQPKTGKAKKVSDRSKGGGNGSSSLNGHVHVRNAHPDINYEFNPPTELQQSTKRGNDSAFNPYAVSNKNIEVVDLHSSSITTSFTPQVVTVHNVREFNIRLNEIDAKLAKFDNTEESKTTSRALSSEQSNDNLSDSCDPKS